MSVFYLLMIIFLFSLAIVDLWVGVSNDAVNFLNSAVGSRVTTLRRIILVAAVGVFVGAAVSNGMMDIARHGIFRPEQFSFEEIMCIFMAVMLTDVILLDVFNSLGMPTSTTVSLVFELLGGTFCLACIKVSNDPTLAFSDLLNTEKALQVILGIFLSVGIAFVVGTIVQWLTRLIFTFNYKPRLRWFIGLFGGLSITAILYFVLIKTMAKSPYMPAGANQWIADNTTLLMLCIFAGCTVLMQLLYWLKVNVFKIIILFGTFALALAFASNDLVNFVGVPLAALSSYQDYMLSGEGASEHMMGALNAPASTSPLFLIGAGAIMVTALLCSKKAQNVVQTSVNLSRQAEGEEMFGGSRVAKSLVRGANRINAAMQVVLPLKVRRWIDSRFNKDEAIMADGAAFDLIRASVNLVLAGLLIIMGTSLKLPLSTTYVTFIVAMGTSLADRAWTRESAVYRITGVLSVIGGWFLTAAVAFLAAMLVCLLCHSGGIALMLILILVVSTVLIVTNVKARRKAKAEAMQDKSMPLDNLDKLAPAEVWDALKAHHTKASTQLLQQTRTRYWDTCCAMETEDLRALRHVCKDLEDMQQWKRRNRSRELMAMRRLPVSLSLEKNTWFHLGSNAGEQMLYGMKRIAVPCCEHLDSGFSPLPEDLRQELHLIAQETTGYYDQAVEYIQDPLRLPLQGGETESSAPSYEVLLEDIESFKLRLSALRKKHLDRLTTNSAALPQQTALLYLNILQETQQLLSELRHFLRAYHHFSE